MLNVFVTIDTELSVLPLGSPPGDIANTFARDIYAKTDRGEFGILYQIKRLNSYGLKGVFFVESLFADAVGPQHLAEIVAPIIEGGHEVQLHLHSEWLAHTARPVLVGKTGSNMKDFNEDDQTALVARGLENLRNCGVSNIRAFRAGNYGADFGTLRALARNGILFDTSYNVYYLDSQCALRTEQLLTHPTRVCGVYEFPISFFRDWPGHYRHTQLSSISSREMAEALHNAWRHGWYSFVIVSHSFELLNGHRRRRAGSAVPDYYAIDRFEKLCRLLADHRDKFRTSGFSDIDPATIPPPSKLSPLSSPLYRTAWRYAEQLARRIS